METKKSIIPLAGFVLAVLCALGAIMAGFGTKWWLWDFRTGFSILKIAALGGLTASLVSAFGLILAFRECQRRAILAAAGIFIGAVVFYTPFSWWSEAKRLPVIHDITTDTLDPPRYSALVPVRKTTQNGPEYGGEGVAMKQHAAYPDIKPLALSMNSEEAFEKAFHVAKKMGWEIEAADPAEGRIEATATTFWFGFKDDVAVRLKELDGGRTRVDVRSSSRAGKSDIGTNAKRVRKYLDSLAG